MQSVGCQKDLQKITVKKSPFGCNQGRICDVASQLVVSSAPAQCHVYPIVGFHSHICQLEGLSQRELCSRTIG